MSVALPRKVSVIVPTRDRPATLRQALASIRAAEGPDLAFEILVGDNGKSDVTRTVALEFGALYFPVDVAGASAARNAGLKAATGDYLAFLDDDDVWLPENIRPQLAILDARPSIDAVIGQITYVDNDLRPLTGLLPEADPGEGDDLLRRMLSGFFPQIGTFVARMRVRELAGEFDLALLGGQDLDWMLRTARRRTVAFTATNCAFVRTRPPGTYDKLNRKRVGYDRKVFLRHAVPERRLWKTPLGFSRAYSGTLMHFYDYFTEAAESRADKGQRADAIKASLIAASIFPARAAWHLIRPTPLRRAAARILGLRQPAQQPNATDRSNPS